MLCSKHVPLKCTPRFSWLVLVLVVLVVYQPAVQYDFVEYDTSVAVRDNPHIAEGLSWKSIGWAFTTTYYDYWHPLTWLTHMIDIELFGFNAGGHHLTNIVLHAINVCLVFLFIMGLGMAPASATVAAALFAVHPIHVESVAWVVERKDLLSALFWYASLLAYMKYARAKSVVAYAWSVMALALSLMAKPMAVTLPLVLLLLDLWPLGRWAKAWHPECLAANSPLFQTRTRRLAALLIEKLPYVALSIASVITTVTVYSSIEAINHDIPLDIRLGNAVLSYCRYLGSLVWPTHLAVLYPFPQSISALATVCCVALLTGLTAAGLLLLRRRPYLTVGWLWYLVTLVPTIGIVHTGQQSHADRFAYIPLVGIYLALAGLWYGCTSKVPRVQQRISRSGVLLVLAGLSILTQRQLSFWRTSVALYSRAVQVTNKNHVMLGNLGAAMRSAERYKEAHRCYDKALEIRPGMSSLLYAKGLVYLDTGDSTTAVAWFDSCLASQPMHMNANHIMGQIMAARGNYVQALEHYQRVLSREPSHWKAHCDLATLLHQMGKRKEAEEHFSEAIRLNSYAAEPYASLGLMLLGEGNNERAAGLLTHASTLAPTSAQIANGAGVALLRLGQPDLALMYFDRALETDPSFELAWKNRSVACDQLNSLREAGANLPEPCQSEAHAIRPQQ